MAIPRLHCTGEINVFLYAIAKFVDAFIEGQKMCPPLGFKRPHLMKNKGALVPPSVKKRVEARSQRPTSTAPTKVLCCLT